MGKNANTNKRPSLREFYEALKNVETRIGQLELRLVKKLTEVSTKFDASSKYTKERMNSTDAELYRAKGEYRTKIEKVEDDCDKKLEGKVGKGWFTAVAIITGILMLVVVIIEVIRLIGG